MKIREHISAIVCRIRLKSQKKWGMLLNLHYFTAGDTAFTRRILQVCRKRNIPHKTKTVFVLVNNRYRKTIVGYYVPLDVYKMVVKERRIQNEITARRTQRRARFQRVDGTSGWEKEGF